MRGAGDHVARVLHVAGRVGDDELAARRGEVAIGDVDRDALLAFGAQAVGEIGQIDLAAAGDVGGAFERLELILHQRFGIVEQPADERGLAVVHGAAGVEAEDVDGVMKRATVMREVVLKNIPASCDLPSRLRWPCRRRASRARSRGRRRFRR